jgi:hypothetical protein
LWCCSAHNCKTVILGWPRIDKGVVAALLVGVPDLLGYFRKDSGEPLGPWLAKDHGFSRRRVGSRE